MAQEAAPLYNFYFRYPWSQNDFLAWQNGMVNLQRGAMEGLFGGAIENGFDLSSVSGMVLQSTTGIAVGPTGNLMVMNSSPKLTFTPPVTFNRWDLVVVQPLLTNAQYISDPDPTSPNFGQPVPLQVLQDCIVSIVQGAESNTPDYPAVPTNAVVIAGIFLSPGMTVFPDPHYFMDTNKRWIYGHNTPFQQNFGRYDDRLRPLKTLGLVNSLSIKPSQLVHPNSRAFSFVNKTMPSIFPKSGGVYNGLAGDTILNFQTGAISGADTTSSAFAPTIPTVGNFINATVGLNANDTLTVVYGTQGTRNQCIDGIMNQASGASAGGVGALQNAKIIAIVTVGSQDGVNITSLEYVDCRGNAAIGNSQGWGTQNTETLTGPTTRTISSSDDGKIFLCNNQNGQVQIQLCSPGTIVKFQAKDVSPNFQPYLYTNPILVLPFSTEKINNVAGTTSLSSPGGEWSFVPDGTNWWGF